MLHGWVLSLPDLQGLESLSGLEELHIKRSSNYPTGLRCLSSLDNLRCGAELIGRQAARMHDMIYDGCMI